MGINISSFLEGRFFQLGAMLWGKARDAGWYKMLHFKYPLRIPLGVVTNKNREKDLATIGTKSPQSGASAFLVPRTAPGAEEVV